MPDPAEIRATILQMLSGGAPVARAALLHAVALRAGIDPRQRKLRAQVAHEIRALIEERAVVDGGPEVWLA
jgi:hypothetical protein